VALWNAAELARSHKHACCTTARLHDYTVHSGPDCILATAALMFVCVLDGSAPDCSISCTICLATPLKRRLSTSRVYSYD